MAVAGGPSTEQEKLACARGCPNLHAAITRHPSVIRHSVPVHLGGLKLCHFCGDMGTAAMDPCEFEENPGLLSLVVE